MTQSCPRVIIESPYDAKSAHGLIVYRNYLTACILDSVGRGEAPFAGHGFYTQFLNDRVPNARRLGLRLARQWLYVADFVAVYENYKISRGMEEGIKLAKMWGKPIEYRELAAGTWHEDD